MSKRDDERLVKKTISVRKIVDSLYHLECKDPRYERNNFEKILDGNKIHEKLGYNNNQTFKTFVKCDGEYVIVGGTPDYIDEDKRLIIELKIVVGCEDKESEYCRCLIDFYLRKGKSQANIYAFLLNKNDKHFENYCVDLYYPKEGKLERYCFKFDEDEALRDICLAAEKSN